MSEMNSRTVAVGDRLALRYPVPQDEAAFCALVAASGEVRPRWVPGPQGPDGVDAAWWFQRTLELNEDERNVRLFVFRRSDDALLGTMNLNEIVRGAFQNAYLGYWIGDPHLRQGYGAEALALALEVAFETMGLHRVEANIQPDNEASRALVRAAGFRLEGLSPRYLKIGGAWRDHERWACTLEDYQAS